MVSSTIKITKTLASELKNYAHVGESYNQVINRLLDEVADDMANDAQYGGITTIGVSEETKQKIKSFQRKPSESYESILVRALSFR